MKFVAVLLPAAIAIAMDAAADAPSRGTPLWAVRRREPRGRAEPPARARGAVECPDRAAPPVRPRQAAARAARRAREEARGAAAPRPARPGQVAPRAAGAARPVRAAPARLASRARSAPARGAGRTRFHRESSSQRLGGPCRAHGHRGWVRRCVDALERIGLARHLDRSDWRRRRQRPLGQRTERRLGRHGTAAVSVRRDLLAPGCGSTARGGGNLAVFLLDIPGAARPTSGSRARRPLITGRRQAGLRKRTCSTRGKPLVLTACPTVGDRRQARLPMEEETALTSPRSPGRVRIPVPGRVRVRSGQHVGQLARPVFALGRPAIHRRERRPDDRRFLRLLRALHHDAG